MSAAAELVFQAAERVTREAGLYSVDAAHASRAARMLGDYEWGAAEVSSFFAELAAQTALSFGCHDVARFCLSGGRLAVAIDILAGRGMG